MEAGEDDPELQREARRTVRFLYAADVRADCAAAVLWWFFGR